MPMYSPSRCQYFQVYLSAGRTTKTRITIEKENENNIGCDNPPVKHARHLDPEMFCWCKHNLPLQLVEVGDVTALFLT